MFKFYFQTFGSLVKQLITFSWFCVKQLKESYKQTKHARE